MSELINENKQGLKWENIISQDFDGVTLASWLPNAKPGYKLFMSFRVTLVINTDWDPYKNKWNTMLCRTEPLAAGTIEIK